MRKTGSSRGLALPDIDPSVALAQAGRNEAEHRAPFWRKRGFDAPSTRTSSMGARKAIAAIRNRTFMPLLILLALMLDTTGALSQVVTCKPILSTKGVREVRPFSPQLLPWKWHAEIIADTSFCATRSGSFEMDFVLIKDYSPDLQFTQAFRWTQDRFEISMELSADEAILEFRVGFVAPCVCRKVGELSSEPRVK